MNKNGPKDIIKSKKYKLCQKIPKYNEDSPK